ncbi:hypothetical protein FG147_06510 [Thauera sp. UPWRP]|nr:hypothetical protein FG147_06510 [Thauera sp. UPWRP]
MRGALITAVIVASAPALAQMPVPLLESDATADPAQWKAAAPLLQASLECRRVIDPADPALRPVMPANDAGQWELTPPRGFSAFGLPVQSITLYIDPDGELGASYTAEVAAPQALAAKAVQPYHGRKGAAGTLQVEPGERPSLATITCTVAGSYEHD